MSLLYWLPFTDGTVKEQGLSNETPTIGGTSVVSNTKGKLGKCLSFGTDDGYIQMPLTAINGVTGSCSVAFWLNIKSFNVSYATIFSATQRNYSWAGELLTFQRAASVRGFTFHISNGTNHTTMGCTSSALEVDTWYHVVCVVDTVEEAIKIYLNGELDSSYATTVVPNYAAVTDFRIGKSYTSYQGDFLMNDFRLYDEVLSPRQIKELSKGLVLHYPLNRGGFGQDNLLLNSTIPMSGSGATGITKYITDDGLQKVVAESPNGNWCTFGNHNTTLPLTKGDSFTFSMMIKSPDSTKKPTVYFQSGLGYYSMQGTMSNNWSIIYYTGIWNIDNLSTNIHLGFSSAPGTYYIKYFKLEKGSIVTPWAPNSVDSLYSYMGLDDGIEYDVSGYGNNGEWYAYDANGSVECTSDTPRYNVSTHIASANPNTNAASGTRYLYGHCSITNPTEMTVAFWCKPIQGYGGNTGNGQFCTTNYEYGNTNVGADYQASAMNHRDSTININDSASTTQCRPLMPFTANEWHHYAVTYDGQTGRTYRDGVLQYTKSFSEPKTLDSFIGVVVGFSKAGTVWRRNDSHYSDFRIYTTCLSADDILALYHTPTSIANNGTLMTQGEISEV